MANSMCKYKRRRKHLKPRSLYPWTSSKATGFAWVFLHIDYTLKFYTGAPCVAPMSYTYAQAF